MAGVDKTILRGCPVWLIGVQREANEIKRNLANIPAGVTRPKAEDIANLDRGQFYACWKDRTVKVYVQPEWMDTHDALKVAHGINDPPPRPKATIHPKKEELVSPQEAAQLTEENARLKRENAELQRRIDALEKQSRHVHTPAAATAPNGHVDMDALYQHVKSRLMAEEPALLKVFLTKPELRIEVKRRTLEASHDTLRGRIAGLIANDFFDAPKPGTAIETELRRQGFACSRPNCYREADKLAAEGFFTKEEGGYQAVAGMKVNIVEG
jgi:regulator of replication initiation timing